MNLAEKAALYQELAKMTQADLHLDRTLSVLARQRGSPARRQFVECMRERLAAGTSVAEALGDPASTEISGLERTMVAAGERSGKLASAFRHLAQYFSAAEAARRQARGAMIYPLVLLHLAIVLPELPNVISTGDTGALAWRIGLALGLLWIVILLAGRAWRALSERARTSPRLDAALNRLPLVGSVRRHWAMARFAQVFHAGLLAALRVTETVRGAGEASQSGLFRYGAEVAAERLDAGEPFAEALASAEVFPVEFITTVATAEEVGALDKEMARWAGSETYLASQAIDRAAAWLPKIFYAVIALFVIYRIIGMVAGYYANLYQFIGV